MQSTTARWVRCTCANPLRHYSLVGEGFASGSIFSLEGCGYVLKMALQCAWITRPESIELMTSFLCVCQDLPVIEPRAPLMMLCTAPQGYTFTPRIYLLRVGRKTVIIRSIDPRLIIKEDMGFDIDADGDPIFLTKLWYTD